MTTLLVASTGGHLKQLHRLHRRLTGIDGPVHWATFDTPQSRSLLDGVPVSFVPFVGGRDPKNILRNVPIAERILRRHGIRTVVSTGSSVALPFFALARLHRLDCHYVESAARSDGPSVTGRLMDKVPGVHLYAQYPAWADDRWRYRGSVFDSFERGPDAEPAPDRIRRVVVTLGTYRGFGFERLLHRLVAVLPEDAEVLWQTGDTDLTGLDIDGHDAIPEKELIGAMAEADVVVAHAGVGTALAAFEVGKCPILVPRRAERGEHIDDHQVQITDELAGRGLVVTVDADDLTHETLLTAARARTVERADDPPFLLDQPR